MARQQPIPANTSKVCNVLGETSLIMLFSLFKLMSWLFEVTTLFFNINEILSSGNWLKNEPFDVLLNLCNEYQIKNKEIDPKKMALKMIKGFNGCLFMWMRFNKDSDFWSTFNDQWFLNESSKIFSEAVSLQNKSQ